MLRKALGRVNLPGVRMTMFNCVGTTASAGTAKKPVAFLGASLMPEKIMPTPLVEPERQLDKSCGTGQPAQRGRRKPITWKRRFPWFDRQWTLDMKRVTKAPPTPTFPNGVPFKPIRKLQSFSGRSFQVNAGRRRKIRLSLKRGRRKLL